MIGLQYEDIFNEDERALFENNMPDTKKMIKLKQLTRDINKALAEDSVQGYLLAAKFQNEKQDIINNTPNSEIKSVKK